MRVGSSDMTCHDYLCVGRVFGESLEMQSGRWLSAWMSYNVPRPPNPCEADMNEVDGQSVLQIT
jgi:hypothetical protein